MSYKPFHKLCRYAVSMLSEGQSMYQSILYFSVGQNVTEYNECKSTNVKVFNKLMLVNNCLVTKLRSSVFVAKMKLWRRGRRL